MDYETYTSHELHLHPQELKRAPVSQSAQPLVVLGDRQYNPCPEASLSDSTPNGWFHRIAEWSDSEIYPGTTRAISIYKSPNISDRDEPRAFAFFNDGDGYLWRQGDVRATYVFDTLTANGELPPIVAVFVNPGACPEHPDQRSIEYDTINSTFVEFIRKEITPLVETTAQVELTTDPTRRLICGISSGGICAFNAAWHSPETFGLVLSHCGSFTNIRGGHNYPSIIRRSPRKPLRVFLQSGEGDLNIVPGSWPIANQDMAAALEFAGYDYEFKFGEGGHSLRHGGAIFADSLRWLFQAE